jgi:hypothetical protein
MEERLIINHSLILSFSSTSFTEIVTVPSGTFGVSNLTVDNGSLLMLNTSLGSIEIIGDISIGTSGFLTVPQLSAGSTVVVQGLFSMLRCQRSS